MPPSQQRTSLGNLQALSGEASKTTRADEEKTHSTVLAKLREAGVTVNMDHGDHLVTT